MFPSRGFPGGAMQEMKETQIWCLGRGDPPGVGNGNPRQDSCLGNSMDRGRSLVATTYGWQKLDLTDWAHSTHIIHSITFPFRALGKLHSYTSSRSLSPDLGQATIHLNNWPISKALSIECSGPPSFVRKGMYHLQSGFCVSGTLLSRQHLSSSHQESK